MTKISIVFCLLCLFVFMAIITQLQAKKPSTTDCTPFTEAGYKVVCGPSYPGSQLLFHDQTKTIGDAAIYVADLTMTNAHIEMTEGSTLIIDGGGCTADDSVCTLDNGDPNPDAAATMGTTYLKLENSTFSHSKDSEDTTIVKDNFRIELNNSSILTLGVITDVANKPDEQKDKCLGACLTLEVSDSNVSINQIDLSNSGASTIDEIRITNTAENRGVYHTDINGLVIPSSGKEYAINVYQIGDVILTNADLTIGNDLIVELFMGRVALDNSDFVLKGNAEGFGSIELTFGSVFKAEEYSLITFKNQSFINLTDSTFDVYDLYPNAAEVHITARSKSTFTAHDVRVNPIYLSDLSTYQIDATTESHVTINALDFRSNCVAVDTTQCIKDNNVTLIGDSTSTIDIGNLYINSDYTVLNLYKVHGSIDNIFYEKVDTISIKGSDKDNMNIPIGNINIDSDTGLANLKMQNVTLKIDTITLKDTTDFNWNVGMANITVGDITCEAGCENITIDGNAIEDGVVEEPNYDSSTIIVNNIDNSMNNDGTGTNTFNDVNLTVNDTFNTSGSFSLANSTLNINSLNGTLTSIDVTGGSQLNITGDSNITLTGTATIDQNSSFILYGDEVFTNSKDAVINNSGVFAIYGDNNDLGLIDNSSTGVVNIGVTNFDSGCNSEDDCTAGEDVGSNSHIGTINNAGITNLGSGVTVDNLTNTNTLNIWGEVTVDNFSQTSNGSGTTGFEDVSEPSLNFYLTENADSSLHINNSTAVNIEGNIGINITHTSVLKPGLHNSYEVISSEGEINIEGMEPCAAGQAITECSYNPNAQNPSDQENPISGNVAVLPPWMVSTTAIITNENGGESLWIDIQRLSNYADLIAAVPGSADDEGLNSIAQNIDLIVSENAVTGKLEDVINSLDFNSGCGNNDQLIYEVHQGITTVDISQAPCLYGLAGNMEKLKPVSNEVLVVATHNEVDRTLNVLLDKNRNVSNVQELNLWTSNNLNFDSINSKNYSAGYTGISDMQVFGMSYAPTVALKTSLMVGLGVGKLNGDMSTFDADTINLNVGVSATYMAESYFVSVAGIIANSNFTTDRYMMFLNTQYNYGDRSTTSSATASVSEVAIRAEIGTEYSVYSDTFIVPKLILTQALVVTPDYQETGSSGDLGIKGSSVSMTEIGVAADIFQELLIPHFLGTYNAFWYPKVGISVLDRIYQSPYTDFYFVDATNYIMSTQSGDYSGILARVNATLAYEKNNISLEVGYEAEVGRDNYINNSLKAIFNYAL